MRPTAIGLVFLGLTANVLAQGDPPPSPIFQVGEELQYSVRWKFIRLGTITFNTEQVTDSSSPSQVRILMTVQSSRGIPVVTLREENRAVMDIARMRSMSFSATHELNGHRQTLQHTFEPDARTATAVQMEGDTGNAVTKVLQDVDWYVEGVTLFFYAREAARRGMSCKVPTLVNQEIARTTLNIDERPQYVRIDAVDYTVRSRRLSGVAEWTGSAAGVTGDFEGWVSDDDSSVILRAELDIFLGSIDIELEQWRRTGWQPPSVITAAK